MFALFPHHPRPAFKVVHSLTEFDAQFGVYCDSARKYFDSQDKSLHGELDMELTSNIEDIYQPILGPWEKEPSCWWHNMDYYGDGVRGLSFVWDRFPRHSLSIVHQLLGQKFVRFSVIMNFHEEFGGNQPHLGRLWMDSQNLLMTRSIAERLACAA